MDGPETDQKSETVLPKFWVVQFDLLHSLESNIGEVANPDWVFFGKPEWAVDIFRPDGSDTEDDDQFDPTHIPTTSITGTSTNPMKSILLEVHAPPQHAFLNILSCVPFLRF